MNSLTFSNISSNFYILNEYTAQKTYYSINSHNLIYYLTYLKNTTYLSTGNTNQNESSQELYSFHRCSSLMLDPHD